MGVPGRLLLFFFLSFGVDPTSPGSSVMFCVNGLNSPSPLLTLPVPLLSVRLALPVLETLLPRLARSRSFLLSPGTISTVPSSMYRGVPGLLLCRECE